MDPYIIEIFTSEWYITNILSLLALLLFLTGCFFLLKSNFIKKNELERKFRKILGFLILSRFLISYIYQASNGLWNIEHSLPFHLCGISGIAGGILLLRYNQSLYEFVLLLGAPGALWSFITPQLNVLEPGAGFYNPSFMYLDYFISHAAIVFVPLYFTFFLGKKPRPLSYFKIFIKVNIFIVPIIALINIMISKIFNLKFVNYMYLMRPPEVDNPFIVDSSLYIAVMEFVAFMHMVIIYSFFIMAYKFKPTLNIKERIA